MNGAKLRDLRDGLADLLGLVDELMDEDGDTPPPTEKAPRRSRRRSRRALEYPAPLQEPSEVDRMRAKKMLERRGIYK